MFSNLEVLSGRRERLLPDAVTLVFEADPELLDVEAGGRRDWIGEEGGEGRSVPQASQQR